MFKFYESSRGRDVGRISASIYWQLKCDLSNYENHKFNVKHATHTVDDGPPRRYSHVYNKPKRLLYELERFGQIQRGNNSLMQRIAAIQREGSRIDHKNYHKIKSLNTRNRQLQMIELSCENKAKLARLMNVHPVHFTSKIKEEHLECEKHRAKLIKYPKTWRQGVLQMNLWQRRIRAQVWAFRTGKYKPYVNKHFTLMTMKKEAIELLRKEKEAQAEKEAEEQRQAQHKAHLQLAKELKRREEQRKIETQHWREARAERLKQIEKQKERKENQLAAEKKKEEEARKKRTFAAKQKINQWKSLHEEEQEKRKMKQSEEERKMREERERIREAEEKKKKRLAEWKLKKATEEERMKEEKAKKDREYKEDLENRIKDRMKRRGEVSPKVYKVAKSQKSSGISGRPKDSEVPRTPEDSEVPRTPEDSEVPRNPEAAEVSKIPDAKEVSKRTEASEEFRRPDTSGLSPGEESPREPKEERLGKDSSKEKDDTLVDPDNKPSNDETEAITSIESENNAPLPPPEQSDDENS